ncbi:MAG: imidazoleglycerol-phosphate dehydratase [Thermoproteota archaeon]
MDRCRIAKVERFTNEVKVSIALNLDGKGKYRIDTPYKMFNHLLSSTARFSSFDLEVEAKNIMECNEHHLVEDVAICLGQSFDKALDKRTGISRFGFSITPMDECLVLSSVDLSGRGGCYQKLNFRSIRIGDLPTSLIPHFFSSFATNGRFTLHLGVIRGGDEHHVAEALFKSVGLSLGSASRVVGGEVPSTKGML